MVFKCFWILGKLSRYRTLYLRTLFPESSHFIHHIDKRMSGFEQTESVFYILRPFYILTGLLEPRMGLQGRS